MEIRKGRRLMRAHDNKKAATLDKQRTRVFGARRENTAFHFGDGKKKSTRLTRADRAIFREP
ncbi:hypothetical protein EN871_20165 [bacterium M00.F.Ca.ET.228.01.1.1]|uniref:hypothetical protein n=1 Tax=Paraburkholderia phenoliruptrix TaxID=252970 RepID=UPI0010920B4D|nr:hypothetical protein [Paraburkholderia phenoliruptrix]TGP42501.1 hypothetical protein EN871_20165 [bacterium M00.F.Ca.ET.228.01.1.1]TGS00152.1 hypothetical protein EN834_18350 [bacterium M00.F.Ca.ET.191.01.1.1]TGU04472.1 hypothetical protein EN798_19170 [bacterium M00.F.Ca.ET.155.01.1.1]MBW0449980.1 hypothetical protein [Paraburkholderia phenoliruptrix]MBW9098732.1 hypothetical protein [Paraburkholderia phenoliruptrix]